MTRNRTVKADPNAPGVTALLARFVIERPSRGWSDAVEARARRSVASCVGCAIGPAQHEPVQAAPAAVQVLPPAPTSLPIGRVFATPPLLN